jgi:hypothetical protein
MNHADGALSGFERGTVGFGSDNQDASRRWEKLEERIAAL